MAVNRKRLATLEFLVIVALCLASAFCIGFGASMLASLVTGR